MPVPTCQLLFWVDLQELKALIGQLDAATKSTMKDSLYRISRHAQGPGGGEEASAAATAAQAAATPNFPDEIGPVDRCASSCMTCASAALVQSCVSKSLRFLTFRI